MRKQEEVKPWTVKRKSALVLEIIQGKSTVSEAGRAYELMPSVIETGWTKAKGHGNALRSKPEDAREQYERQDTFVAGLTQPDAVRAALVRGTA